VLCKTVALSYKALNVKKEALKDSVRQRVCWGSDGLKTGEKAKERNSFFSGICTLVNAVP